MGLFNLFKQDDLPKPDNPTASPSHRYLEMVLRQWLDSDLRKEQLLGEKYYDGDHDILRREKKVIGPDGQLIVLNNVINNKIVDNQYRKLVDQKTNYCLGKPITIATDDENYLELLHQIFTKDIHRKLRTLAQFAVDGGIAWLYPHYDEEGNFQITIFPSYQICPIWKDSAHTKLQYAMRYYTEDRFNANGGLDKVYHVELFTKDGIDHFYYKGQSLLPAENPHSEYVYVGDSGFNWERIPLIPFKYNSKEIPLIRNVKSLQDSLNEAMSDFQNNMQEDPRTSILVLKNYDGTNIAEFRQNLSVYGVIKVTTVDGVQGGVDTLKVEPNAQNYQANIMQIKRAIIENGRGFDAKEERMDGDPNQMNIQSMYTDIDLDVNAMETEFQAGFEELKWFIDNYLKDKGEGDFFDEEITFVFNRDIFINEDAMIANCMNSVGVISNKTITARHPWTTSLQRELNQMEEEKAAEMEDMKSTLQIQSSFAPKPTAGKPPVNPKGGGDE